MFVCVLNGFKLSTESDFQLNSIFNLVYNLRIGLDFLIETSSSQNDSIFEMYFKCCNYWLANNITCFFQFTKYHIYVLHSLTI